MSEPECLPPRAPRTRCHLEQRKCTLRGTTSEDGHRQGHGLENEDVESALSLPCALESAKEPAMPSQLESRSKWPCTLRPGSSRGSSQPTQPANPGKPQQMARPPAARQVAWRTVLWAVLVLLVTGLMVEKQVSLRASLQTCSSGSEILRQQLQELHQRASVRGGSDLIQTKDRAAVAAWGDEDMASKMAERVLQLEAELKQVSQRLASTEGQLTACTLARGKLEAPSQASHVPPKAAAPAKAPKSAPKPAQHASSH